MKQYVKTFNEKIVYNRTLNPKFWQNGKFDQGTRTTLLQIANDFYNDLKLTIPIVDIHLTGSMANYTWSEHSDLDVHVHVDFSLIDENTDLVRDALLGKKFVWNLRHPVQLQGHDVELYIQDDKSHTVSSGIYSLLNNEWITKPTYDPPEVDMYYVAAKVEDYKKEIEELDKILDDDTEDDSRLIFDRTKVLKKKISSARDIGLQRDGEFSIENLVFKELRNQGYIGALVKLQARAYSQIYSDDDFEPDQTKIMQEAEEVLSKKNIINKMPNQLNEEIQARYDYFINEVLTDDERAVAADELRNIQDLISRGMIDKSMFIAKRREIMKKVGGISKLVSDPILGEVSSPDLYQAMQSPEYEALRRDGWYESSTDKQKFNGTLAITTEHATVGGANNLPTSIAISGNGYIRRIWTAGPNSQFHSFTKHMDGEPQVLVGNLHGTGVDAYTNAFRWIKSNINPMSPGLLTLTKPKRTDHGTPLRRYGYR